MTHIVLDKRWRFRQAGESEWLPATVPGGVHTDLMALGLLADPFAGDNEKHTAWVAERDWEYRTTFDLPADAQDADALTLVADGLDTLAEVWCNGSLLGSTENMFRQYRWEIGALVKPANAEGNSLDNELVVRFASPVRYCSDHNGERFLPGVPQALPGSPYLRKAPCQFGWDWGPQLPPIGIWKEMRIEVRRTARIEDIHLRQQHGNGKVQLTAEVAIARLNQRHASLAARLTLVSPQGKTQSVSQPEIEDESTTLALAVLDPQLWWPNGYGKQPLYRVLVELLDDGTVIDQRELQAGLRTLELRQQPDEWGKSFEFVVNGQRIFAKGANWIPADSFPTRITNAQLEALLGAAAVSHQNMLRVWGGGFYEEERFYDLCDKYGILVWQDFVFSCSIYPLDDPAFLENVRVEVEQNVRRLRHRASLALWCGNNEMEWGWVDWGWRDQPVYADLRAAYDRFFHHTLPAWCNALDPDRAYWPSSPSSDTPFVSPNGQEQGDAHYWDVWHGRKPFTAYRSQFPRFMSEFGFQALPPLATIATYAQPSDWNMTSYIMEQHQKNDSGNSLMVGQMLDTYQLPNSFPSLVYMSLVLQAEGIRYGVEHWRRNMHRVAGTLYWQLNDCWPVASWSSIDYFGRWKALHYAARRFFAPLLLSIEDAPPVHSLHITSDLSTTWQGTMRWSLERLDGTVLANMEESVEAKPFANTHVRTLDFAGAVSATNQRDLVLVAELWEGESRIALQVATFVPTKHLALRAPEIATQVKLREEVVQVQLTTDTLARHVELSLREADAIFSDNYFDLPANRTVTVSVPLPAGWSAQQFKDALVVRSLYNAFTDSTAAATSEAHPHAQGESARVTA